MSPWHHAKYTCPCCGWKTLDEKPPGTFAICAICFWEDDNLQFDDPDYEGGANHPSLRLAQKNYLEFGAKDRGSLEHVRKPTKEDERDLDWKPARRRGVFTRDEAIQYLKEHRPRQKTEIGRRVSKILFEIDPMDLGRYAVPEDEYDSEAEMIVERLSAGRPLSTKLIQDVFETMFGPQSIDNESAPEAYEKIVKALEPIASKIIKQNR